MIGRVIFAVVLASSIAIGQSATAPAKHRTFEIISIHPSAPGTPRSLHTTVAPDGYREAGEALSTILQIAYFPSPGAWSMDHISGAPNWVHDQYDISAKVSEADRAQWQTQGVTLDKEQLFMEMLRSMLADRFHLVAHMTSGPPVSGYSLELGKLASRLTPSKPDSLPPGPRLPGGGVLIGFQPGKPPSMNFYGVTIAEFADFMAYSVSRPIQDHTGLTGKYDLVIQWVSDPDLKSRPGIIGRDDSDPLSHWNFDAAGLKPVLTKVRVDTLVIDHIEKPSDN